MWTPILKDFAFARLTPSHPSFPLKKVTVRAAAPSTRTIEEEVALDEAPLTLLREGGGDDAGSMRAKFEKMIRAAQNEICSAVEELDGQKFQEDAWTRPGGGGGISRVLQGGNVF